MSLERRMNNAPDEQPIVTRLGDPLPTVPTMVELAPGRLVSLEEFGSPPPGLMTIEEIDAWYENREDELLFGENQ